VVIDDDDDDEGGATVELDGTIDIVWK
jgi:hypothetical protein